MGEARHGDRSESRLVHQRLMQQNFTFQLTAAAKAEVITNCDHLARFRFAKSRPFAFGEHNLIMAATSRTLPKR
jgi:hypothetical protein